MDPTTVQLPGVSVSAKEEAITNSGLLDNSFEVQLRMQNNATDVTIFQNLANNVFQINPNANFIPWNLDNKDLPDINTSNLRALPQLFKLIDYLGHYNKTKASCMDVQNSSNDYNLRR